ncbi:MAG: hypothetical protein KAS72_04535 [Phycisphaerales bacterium]|nr:hypothetical protein [Phycisphaerales bacterium]
MESQLRRLGRLMRGCVLATGLLIAAMPATAQPGGGGRPGGGRGGGGEEWMTRLFLPDVTSREIDEMARTLGMDDDQQAAADAMLETYLDEFTETARERRTEWETLRDEIRESRDRSRFAELAALHAAWRGEKRTLEAALLDDIQLLLDETQAQRWPIMERNRRRLKVLPRGRLSGETLNIIDLVEKLDLSQEAAMTLVEPLGDYELDLDRALVEREAVVEVEEPRLPELLMNQDFVAASEVYRRVTAARRIVQKVNKRYARQIEALLPDEQASIFARQVLEKSYPRVFERSAVDRIAPLVQSLESLDAEQGSTVDALMASFERDREVKRMKAVKLIEREEATDTPRWERRDMSGAGEMDERRQLRQEIRQIEIRTLRSIRSLLTDEQIQELPADLLNELDRRDDRDRQNRPGDGNRRERPGRSRPGD